MRIFNTSCVCLYSLTLEWNELGLIENAFSVFCDGVGANSSLLVLDLRSNKISHVGASELANALKRNSTLQTLGVWCCHITDFVWIGIVMSLQVDKMLGVACKICESSPTVGSVVFFML